MSNTPNGSLPIHRFKNELLYLIENNSVVIVVGPTGSGKTTQIPQFLLKQGWTGIACTQPRRLSAIAMANRVSHELGLDAVGKGIVGYSVRFDDFTSEKTRCRFITDGMLFRECLHDPLLSKYSVIMIDEAHERTLHTDLLLAMIKKILPRRPELRVIISSATIDAVAFKKYFTLPRIDLTGKKLYGPLKPNDVSEIRDIDNNLHTLKSKEFIPKDRWDAKIISVEGRTFPVQTEFLLSGPADRMIQSEEVIVDAVTRLVRQINDNEENGDILVFLAGRSEIEKCFDALSSSFNSGKEEKEEDVSELMGLFKKSKTATKTRSDTKSVKLDLLQLYAGMSASDQLKVFEPARPGTRKVILSTNIAEASITIDGIVYVIDSGRVKVRVFAGDQGEKMVTIPISKASADQRAGRAGRTRPGIAFRLYTQEFFATKMPRHSLPDLQLSKLTAIILQLKAMRIDNLLQFDFLSPLPAQNVKFALEELFRLKALDLSGALSDPLGRQMAQLPLEPELGHFLLRASEWNCPREGAALAAMLTIQNQNDFSTFFFPNAAKLQRRFWVEEGDHLTLLSIFMSYLANAESSVKFCQKYGLNLKNLIAAHKLYSTLLAYLRKAFMRPTERETKMSVADISVVIRKCLISALPLNVAKSDESRACYTKLQPSKCGLHVHPNSVLFKRLPPLVVYGQCVETTKLFMKFVSLIEADWLEEIHPNFYKQVKK